MANLTLKNVYKVYNEVVAVNNFSLEIKDKEFVVFVGPSGCGKTTTLRMIAGLEKVTSGEIYIGEKLVNFVEPKDRDIAMVFQNYALYPHMSVYNNMAFSLKMRRVPFEKQGIDKKAIRANRRQKFGLVKRLLLVKDKKGLEAKALKERIALIDEENKELKKTPRTIVYYRHYTKAEIEKKVYNAAKMLEIEPYLLRKPKALSGGQRQRVAIGRAIVRDPKVFLMDEPLSNLDAKLRNQMRAELILLRKRIDTTFVYVTHDQTEAMTLGDKIVIMKDGFIQQVGAPDEVFKKPANLFVAGFIGTPQMNFFSGKLTEKWLVQLEETSVKLPDETLSIYKANGVKPEDIILGIRPEHMKLCEKNSLHAMKGEIMVVESMGSAIHLHISIGEAKNVVVIVPTMSLDKAALAPLSAGHEVYVNFDPALAHVFSKESGANLLLPIVKEKKDGNE
jgi:multiple sugar transport system ATP-binding protein